MQAKVFDFELNAHDDDYNFETVLQIVCEDEQQLREMADFIVKSIERKAIRKSDGKFIVPFGGNLIRMEADEFRNQGATRFDPPRKTNEYRLLRGEPVFYPDDRPN